jgi:hypothetical protein
VFISLSEERKKNNTVPDYSDVHGIASVAFFPKREGQTEGLS